MTKTFIYLFFTLLFMQEVSLIPCVHYCCSQKNIDGCNACIDQKKKLHLLKSIFSVYILRQLFLGENFLVRFNIKQVSQPRKRYRTNLKKQRSLFTILFSSVTDFQLFHATLLTESQLSKDFYHFILDSSVGALLEKMISV